MGYYEDIRRREDVLVASAYNSEIPEDQLHKMKHDVNYKLAATYEL
jgi:hypothetical protein